jgi:Cobalamin biosynthesis protein CobT VWA domain
MGKMITGGEVYEAIRETCQRLYIAAGGDKSAIWTVKPFPETACIAVGRNGKFWHLGMPAIPATARLTTREADMFVAFGVHEILHALWTDFRVVAQSSIEGLHSLCNALEDCRIENKARRGLPAVAEAATLLEVLTNHVVAKASEKAPYRLDDERNFAFTLGNIIFVEKLKYRLVDFPRDWRAEVPAHWLPVIDLALTRFGSLRSTQDVLILARDLRALGQTLQPQQGEGEGGKGKAKPQDGDMGNPAPSNDASGAFPKKPDNEKGEGDKAAGDEAKGDEGEGDKTAPDNSYINPETGEDVQLERDNEGEGEGEGEAKGDEAKGDEAKGDEGEGAGDEGEGGAGDEGEGAGDEGEGGAGDEGKGGAGGDGPQGGTSEGRAPIDLTDMQQNAPDAKLNDVADNASRREGMSGRQAEDANRQAEDFFNAIDGVGYRENIPVENAYMIDAVRAALSAPAKLRRDVTLAVKSPERVGRDRRQTTGRMDMRLSAQMRAGSQNVFSRRHDETGVQAAVSLLVDMSSSMRGARAQAAAALALHLGDALKAAGVKFEIGGYYQMSPREDGACRARLGFCKEMNAGWTQEARGKTAALAHMPSGGTATMPAAKEMARRLLNERNATRRILLVLTDGADCYSPESMKACRDFYAKLGVEIVALAIMVTEGHYDGGFAVKQLLQRSFGKNVTFVNNLSQIATAGLHELVTVLNASDRAALQGKAA